MDLCLLFLMEEIMSKFVVVFVVLVLACMIGCKSTSHSLYLTTEVDTGRLPRHLGVPELRAVVVFHHDKIAPVILEADEED